MGMVIVNGSNKIIDPALEYLERRYGMSRGDIQCLQVDAPVGDVLKLTVTLFVDAKDLPS